jgi:hypothetical protein
MTINLDQYTNTLSVTDTATNADLTLVTKGTGVMKFNNGGGEAFRTLDAGTTSGSAYWTIKGSSGGFPFIGVDGTNPNITATFTAKGTSGIQLVTNNGGVLQALVSHTASAVNYVQVTGAATGNAVNLSAQGSDTNIQFNINSKNAFGIQFGTGGGTQFFVSNTAAAANYLRATGGATGFGPVLSAQGSDTNIDLTLTPKGTGNVQFGTHTATADTAISGYITIKDSGGTVRKLAVIT